MTEKDDRKMFSKGLILNDFSQEYITQCTLLLLIHMKEINEENSLVTLFMTIRLKNPETLYIGDVRELRIEWCAIKDMK